MSAHFPLTKLGSLIELANGKTSPNRSENGGWPVFGSNGVIGAADEANSDAETIVIGRVGSYCGSVYYSPTRCWVTDNAIRGTAKGQNSAIFLYYLLKQLNLNNWRSGSGQPLLNQSTLNSIEVRVPTPDIQRAVGSFLAALDDRIDLLRETNATLEAIAQALFKSWFVDFDPVHANAGTQAPSLPPEIQALFPATFTDTPQGPIPEGWEFGTIADLGEVICGKTPATSEPLNYGTDVPFITIPDMHGKLVVTNTARSLSKVGANTQAKKFLRAGSICVSCIATPGLVVRVTVPSQTNQQINSVVPLPKWGDSYPLFALQRVGELVRAEGSGGSVFHNLNKSGFEKIPMLLPDVNTVGAFNNVAESLVAKITENQKTTQSLAELRDTLLPRLISGQLRLPEAEQAIAAITD